MTRKKSVRFETNGNPAHSLLALTKIADTTKITRVLIKVAKFELIPATPIFPKSAVNPAKKADPNANQSHEGKIMNQY